MARSVKVDLILEVSKYLRGAREAEKSTKGVADSLADAAKAGDETARAGDNAAKAMNREADAAKKLDRDIDGLKGSLKELATAYALAGDEAGRLDISKQIRAQQTELRRALSNRKLLGDAGDDAAKGFAARFVGRLGPLVASAPIGPHAAALGAGVAVVLGPTIAAGIAGAVVGGAGIGGVIGGVVLAAKDPAVKAEAAGLGALISEELEDAAKPFVPATIDALQTVRGEFNAANDDIRRIFEDSADYLDPLAEGASRGTRLVIEGFADAVSAAGPVVDKLGESFERIGAKVGDVFSTLSQDADEGASALDDLTIAAENFIGATGEVAHRGAQVKGVLDEIDIAIDKGRYIFEDYIIDLDLTADGFKKGSAEAFAYRRVVTGTATAVDYATLANARLSASQKQASDFASKYVSAATNAATASVDATNAAQGLATKYSGVASSAAAAAVAQEAMNAEIREAATLALGASNSQIALEQAIDDAAGSIRGGSGALDINTQKGRDNARALNTIAAAAQQVYDDVLAQTNSQEKATAAANRGRSAFITLAQKMGYSATEARTLADRLFGIPNVNRSVNVKTAQAKSNIAGVQAALNAIHDVTVYVNVRSRNLTNAAVAAARAAGAQRWGGVYEHAQTGLLREAATFTPVSPARYAFAEPATMGEAFIPKRGNPDRSLAILQKAASWYGAMVTKGSGATVNITNHIHAAPGQSVRAIAEEVARIQGRQANVYART